MDFRLRLDSAVDSVESDSFSGGSPCSSAEHSPNLTEKSRLGASTSTITTTIASSSTLVIDAACLDDDTVDDDDDDDKAPLMNLLAEDNDNVSDESGYADDKDAISSSSSASDVAVAALRVPFLMAEEFTLNL